MPATILLHPGLQANAANCERLTERLADLLAREELLRWQTAPEVEALYWQLFGDLETRQPTTCVDGAAWRARRRITARVRDAQAHHARRSLSATERAEFIHCHRRLVRLLHPLLDQQVPGRTYLWKMVRRACRDGDLRRLRECDVAAGDRDQVAAVGLSAPALRRALAEVQVRLSRLEGHFPLNLRERLADPRWVAARRQALRGRLPVQSDCQLGSGC